MTTYENSQIALDTILSSIYTNAIQRVLKYDVDVGDIVTETAIGFGDGVVISNNGFEVIYTYQNGTDAIMSEFYTLYIKTDTEDVVTKAIEIINLLLDNQTYKQTNTNKIVTIYPMSGRSENYKENRKWFSIDLEIK